MTPVPEDPSADGPDGDDSPSSDAGDGALRGWIDPDDRLWRHPSELLAGAARAARAAPRTGLRHGRTMTLIGVGAALAAVAWTAVLLSPASDHPAPGPGANSDAASDLPLTTLAVRSEAMPEAAEDTGHSMVELRARTGHGTVQLVGVAVAEGGVVATPAQGLEDLHSLVMIGNDGRAQPAKLVAVDGASDVALVDVPVDLPVASFSDDAALSAGSRDMTLTMAPGGGSPMLECLQGSVTAVGAELQSGWAKGMPSITTSAPAADAQVGDPLLNRAGDVIGLLYSGGASPSFLPTQLVLGVADDLRSTGKVDHGWLGVQGATAPNASGALVATLMSDSPATGLLHAGDVVVAMNSMPVRSMAELRARLYVMAPDQRVGLSVKNGSATRVVDVTLSPSP